jgi:hypothetical protein
MLGNRLGTFLCVPTLSAALTLGCSGEVEIDAANGGAPSSATTAGSSGGSGSTGGSASFMGRCNGLFDPQFCAATALNVPATSHCDIPFTSSPLSPDLVVIAIDCEFVPLVPGNNLDAGSVDGFVIDYNWNPAHLELLGAYCGLLQATGVHVIDVIEICMHAH